MRTEQAEYHASFRKWGPFWFWRGWHEKDDEWSSPWGRGVALSKQSAIWAARRRMVGRIVRAHREADRNLHVDGNELVTLADADHLAPTQQSGEGQG